LINRSILRTQGQSLLPSSFKATQANAKEIHIKAGHPSGEAPKLMFGVDFNTMSCELCQLSNTHWLPFSSTLPDAKQVLNFIYMDLSGKITPKSTRGAYYYFKINNSLSLFKCVFILSHKSQAFEKFKLFCNEVHNFHSQPIKNVVTDRGGEFWWAEFEQLYAKQGIIHYVTAPYPPQQNSIAERGNRTTSKKARALLKQARLPSTLWGEAVITAIFYKNITPMKRLKWKSPHEIWYRKPFDYLRLHSFGCCAYVNIPKEKRIGKFGNTSKKGILVGYWQGIHNWRILTAGNRVKYSHDVVFDHTCFPGISPDKTGISSLLMTTRNRRRKFSRCYCPSPIYSDCRDLPAAL
jgi:hypothetical protein